MQAAEARLRNNSTGETVTQEPTPSYTPLPKEEYPRKREHYQIDSDMEIDDSDIPTKPFTPPKGIIKTTCREAAEARLLKK
jgi:hypothetical protein